MNGGNHNNLQQQIHQQFINSEMIAGIDDDPEIRDIIETTDSGPSYVPSPNSRVVPPSECIVDAPPPREANPPQAAAAPVAAAVAAAPAAPPTGQLPPIPEEKSIEFFHKLYTDLPIIRSSVDLTSGIYGFVKDCNCISYNILDKAEGIAGAVTNPIVNLFMIPLRRLAIDDLLCSTLDFVEKNVPCIKLQPDEMIRYVCTGRCALDCVCKTGMTSLIVANRIKNVLLCRPAITDTPDDSRGRVYNDGRARLRRRRNRRLALNIQKYQLPSPPPGGMN